MSDSELTSILRGHVRCVQILSLERPDFFTRLLLAVQLETMAQHIAIAAQRWQRDELVEVER